MASREQFGEVGFSNLEIGWLVDEIMDAALSLIPGNPSTDGACLVASMQSDVATYGELQFICGSNHWVLASTVTGKLEVFDSLQLSTLPMPVVRQIFGKYVTLIEKDEDGEFIHAKMIPLPKQPNFNDCGVYCIAYSFEITAGGDPQNAIYLNDSMRPHLISALQNSELIPFPSKKRRGRKTTAKLTKLRVV